MAGKIWLKNSTAIIDALCAVTHSFHSKAIMPKNKRPPPKKASVSPEKKEDVLIQRLCDMAIDLVEQEDSESMAAALQEMARDFHQLIRKCLYQKKDPILYEALARAIDADSAAYQLLKESIEEAAGVIQIRCAEGQTMEVNAFVIPLFARTLGGLDSQHCFQDQEAFDLLRQSFKSAQLESPEATVVLISHAYHMDEIDSISYSHLNEMVAEACASMSDMRGAATRAIDRSFGSWPENHFSPSDPAAELRFLLGFVLKPADDKFYVIPKDETAADHYFEVREQRFQRWAEEIAPLIKRCLAPRDAPVEVDFLYQDMFHNGKERGIAEYFLLQMLSELTHGLDTHGTTAGNAIAIVGPAIVAEERVLQVQLISHSDGSLIASVNKSLGIGAEVSDEIDDIADALISLDLKSISLARQFDAKGRPVDARPYHD